jgi:uncharacterized protein
MKAVKPSDPIENLAIGRVIEVDGSHIVAELDRNLGELSRVYAGETYPIGQFGSIVSIQFGRRVIYGLVSRLRMKTEYEAERGIAPAASADERAVEADLFGEGQWTLDEGTDGAGWTLAFERGVSTYPLPQQTVYLTPKRDLRSIYARSTSSEVSIGEHVGTGGAPCYADLNELLGKHTAVLGSTGTGKSGSVAAIIHSVLEKGADAGYDDWSPRILILDPHNEYGAAFAGHRRLSTDEGSLELPYWLLNLEETVSLVIGRTEFAATAQANIVKNALLAARLSAAGKVGLDPDRLTVDSPVPYLLGDPWGLDDFGMRGATLESVGLVGEVNKQRPENKNKAQHEEFNKVLAKLQSLMKDGRLRFMMSPWDGQADPIGEVVGQFLSGAHPVRIVDLSGVPNEVAGAAASAIARTLFAVKVWQTEDERAASPLLLVCEEAHRYIPNAGDAQYQAAQESIRRLAKEGRKYGIGLMLVSQRPSEVETTVLSQCNSWIVLRLTNESDRNHVRTMLPDSMAGLTRALSGLRRQEAIFVGEAAMLPSRVLIRTLKADQLPRSHDIDFLKGWRAAPIDESALEDVATRWRYQQRDS